MLNSNNGGTLRPHMPQSCRKSIVYFNHSDINAQCTVFKPFKLDFWGKGESFYFGQIIVQCAYKTIGTTL